MPLPHLRFALQIGFLAALVSHATSAWSEKWTVYSQTDQTQPRSTSLEIDVDSVENVGPLLKYRIRSRNQLGAVTYGNVRVADCENQRTGFFGEQGLFEAREGSRESKELGIACAVVPIKRPDATPSRAEPNRVTGSGFFVGPRSVVTNAHVIEGCTSLAVRRDQEIYSATLRAEAARSDLALLSLSTSVAAVPAIRRSASLGEDIVVAGHPLSGLLSTDLIVTGGLVNSLAGLGNDPALLQVSAPVQAGNSGGPLIDRSGAIVGVVVSKLDVGRLHKITGDLAQNINFAIKPEVLRMFLDANRVPYRSADAAKRLDGVQIADKARGFTVQVLCTK